MLAILAVLVVQSAGDNPAFNGLRTPVSPAFVVLGITPTAVERPNTPADLAFSILNHSSAFTSLPRDVALEFSPYWLIGHPTLTWQKDATRSPVTSILRTATISFATAELGTSSRPVTGLSLGLRAAPFSGRLSDSTISNLKALDSSLAHESELLNSLMRDREELLKSERNAGWHAARTKADTDAVTMRFNADRAALAAETMQSREYLAAVDSTERRFRNLAFKREGFVLEMAGGAALAAPRAAADSASLLRWGAWITAGYESPTWSFVFVNRFFGSTVDSSFDALDLGMRILYTSGRYALSAEGLFRSFTERGAPANQYRFAAVVDFELRPGVWLTGSVGRDYSAAAPGSLIAQFGLSLDVAGERVEIPVH